MTMLPMPDRDSAAWWAALTEHRFVVQQCSSCSALRWAPRAICNACGSFDWSWCQPSGHGRVVSWTVSHRTFEPDRNAPYVVVLVSLDDAENIVVPGNWAGREDGADLRLGMAVTVGYRDVNGTADHQHSLILWRARRGPT